MTDEVSPMRRFLALHLPWLAAERQRRDAPVAGPFALVAKVRGALVLAAVDSGAAALGLTLGLTLADARARFPDLVAFDHAAAADQRLLALVADACDRYTPLVAIDDDAAGLNLDISGCGHRFARGDDGLAADAVERFAKAGLTVVAALGQTPDAAAALARFPTAGCRIDALPVAALRLDEDAARALRRAGLRCIGDIARQPRPALAARFGAGMTHRLERLLGTVDVRIVPRRAAPPVMHAARLPEPVLTSGAALQVIAALADDAAVALAARGVGGRRFEVALFRTDHHVARLGVDTAQPLRDPRRIAKLFTERLDSLADPLDPGFGYDLIRLEVPVIEPLAALQLQLEGGTAAIDTGTAALVDQLATRLGRARVTRFRSGDSHIPEQAALDLPALQAASPQLWPEPEPGEPPLRPLYLFDPPQRLDVLAEVPDGPPRRFKWRTQVHEILRHEGPERIAAEWWRRADGRGLTRDYYRVEDSRGRRYWVFRHGLYGSEKAHPNWYLHGLFA